MKRPQVRNLLLGLLLPMLAIAGCSKSSSVVPIDQKNSQQIKVVTTFLPMYLFTKAVVGNQADVEILIPPGTEVHEYQATPGNVQAISQANLLVKNGLGLEEFISGTIKNSGNNNLKVIDASQGIKPLQEASPIVEINHTHDNHKHEAGNPHVWIDPVLAQKQVENIRDGIIAVDPKNQAVYQANAAKYIQKLQQLNQQFKQSSQKHPNCTFITFHNAYQYLANRYQLKQVAVVESPEDNLSPADLQRTIATVKQYKVKTLFGEPGVDNKLLNSLSQDLKLPLHSLDSLENGSLDPEYYFEAMKKNLQTLETACS